MTDTILLIVAVALINVLSFTIGAKIGQKVVKGEKIELPKVNPMEVYREVLKRDVCLPSKGDPTVNSFIRALLRKKVTERLCSLEQAKKHQFYKDFNWEDLVDFHLKPPFVPKIIPLKKFSDYKTKYVDFLNEERTRKPMKDDSLLSSYDDDGSIQYPKDWVDEF